MCGLQFFGQISIWSIRIHEGIVRERRAEAGTDDEAVQLRDRIQLALCVKDLIKHAALFIKHAALFIRQGVFYSRQVVCYVYSQLIHAAAGFHHSRLGIDVAENRFSMKFIGILSTSIFMHRGAASQLYRINAAAFFVLSYCSIRNT